MGKSAAFWKINSKNNRGGEIFFSEEFKDLMGKIWALDPNQRISLEGIIAHPWMAGDVPS